MSRDRPAMQKLHQLLLNAVPNGISDLCRLVMVPGDVITIVASCWGVSTAHAAYWRALHVSYLSAASNEINHNIVFSSTAHCHWLPTCGILCQNCRQKAHRRKSILQRTACASCIVLRQQILFIHDLQYVARGTCWKYCDHMSPHEMHPL